jgi:hypothetical protein
MLLRLVMTHANSSQIIAWKKLRITVKRPERNVKSYKRMLADEKEREEKITRERRAESERQSSTMNFDFDRSESSFNS